MKSVIFTSVMLVILLTGTSLALEVNANSQHKTVAQGGAGLSVYSLTHTQVNTGKSIDEILQNVNGESKADNAKFLFSELITTITYTENGVTYKKEVYSSASTLMPTEFSGEQKLSNLIDSWNSESAESIIENVVRISDNEYVFGSGCSTPFNGDVRIVQPLYPSFVKVDGYTIEFGSGYLDTVYGDGVKYTGGMLLKTKISPK